MTRRLHYSYMPDNIYRIEQSHTTGWQVRIWHDKSEYSRFFADNAYNSRSAARKAAEQCRDKLLQWRSNQPTPRKATAKPYYPDARNQTTGVTGVYLTYKLMRSGQRHPYFATTSRRKGKATSRAFSAGKYGPAEAFLLACEVRRGHLQANYPDQFDEPAFNASVMDYLQTLTDNPQSPYPSSHEQSKQRNQPNHRWRPLRRRS